MGFIGGKTAPNGTKYFDPTASLTRGQMSKILAEGYKLTKTKDVEFTDLPVGNGYRDYVSILASENITTGYLDGSFRPSNKISRQHFATFMARMLDDKFKPVVMPKMQVHYIDVGQGDSINIIQSPNGKNMLIDAGTKSSGTKVINFLKSKEVTSLDGVIATHPHADHIGGLVAVLNNFPVAQFIDSGNVNTTQTYLELLELIDSKDIPFKVGISNETLNFDSLLNTKILYSNADVTSAKDASVVTRMVYGSVSFLLTGDGEKAVEADLVSRYGNGLKSTYLKAGHHGFNSSSTAAFINAVRPIGTVFSYGEGNQYGHPHAEVVTRLNGIVSKIYSIAQSGDVTVTTNGTSHFVSEKPWTDNVTPKPVTPGPVPKPEPKPEPPKPKPEPPKPDYDSGLYVNPKAPTKFENCTAMRVYYPKGVRTVHPAYDSKHDRDKDGWASE